tara:strand:+ start:4957 stop:5190 length:234 start_codon:yes stop_codon:yes gene_type:complete
MGNRKQMNESWLNIQWFKRKTLHEYQSGGKDNALKYVEHISEVVSDSDYVELIQYIKELKPEDTNPDKSEEDRLWRI